MRYQNANASGKVSDTAAKQSPQSNAPFRITFKREIEWADPTEPEQDLGHHCVSK